MNIDTMILNAMLQHADAVRRLTLAEHQLDMGRGSIEECAKAYQQERGLHLHLNNLRRTKNAEDAGQKVNDAVRLANEASFTEMMWPELMYGIDRAMTITKPGFYSQN